MGVRNPHCPAFKKPNCTLYVRFSIAKMAIFRDFGWSFCSVGDNANQWPYPKRRELMKNLFCSICLALFILATGPLAAPVAGQDLRELQITEIEGQFLDPQGKPLQEFDYLKPGREYRLMPGARIELSTLDGKYSYRTKGPGILGLQRSGPTLNGKPIERHTLKSSLQNVVASGTHSRELGGTLMRSREGVQVEARTKDGGTKILPLYSGYYALVIGCGGYNKGWPMLPNPLQDARDIAKVLEQIGWDVNLLLDPDWASLRKALNSLITGPGRDRDKAILVWFSGHGHTLAEADGSDLGYIVPVDAPDPDVDEMGFMQRAISMREIETVARRIQSKHVMMVFDSCFSGAIFQLSRAKPPPFIQEKVARPVRQFLTAGNKDEKVPDKSLFKTVFVQGVRDLDADRNKDGYVTGQELGAYLQEQVVNYSRKAQHPQYGKINNPKLDKGDFVLVARPLSGKKTAGTVVAGRPQGPQRGAATPQPKIVADKTASLSIDLGRGPGPGGIPAEEEIHKAIKDWQSAWNGKDPQAILDLYTETASIMTATRKGPHTFSKEGFARIIEKKLRAMRKRGFNIRADKVESITIQGDRARANLMYTATTSPEGYHRPMPDREPESEVKIMAHFEFVKQGPRWLIRTFRFKRL